MNAITTHYQRIVEHVGRLSAVGPLLVRLSLGGMFLATGWGKLHNLEGVTDFFRELGIVAPGFNAHLVATTEFVGGAALLLGFGTRLASVPLAITMTVAILTARLGDVDGVLSFLALEEFTYFAALAWLAVAGGGALSVDAWITRRIAAARRSDVDAKRRTAAETSVDGELATGS